MARLAHGACLLSFGETVVLVTATVQNRQTHLPFFPLTVEYREKTYAAGKIPGASSSAKAPRRRRRSSPPGSWTAP